MAKQTINTGTSANSRDGDSLRAAFTKINANFTELYTALGLDNDGLNLGAFEFSGSTITTTDSTAIVIDQATTVTSDLTVGGDIVPSVANGGDLGSLAKPFRSLYVSNNTVYFGGVPLSLDAGTNELTINNIPISQTISYEDIPDVPTDISDLTDTGNLITGGGVTSYNDLTDKPVLFSGSYNDLTNKPDLAGTYQFSVAADDSTQRLVSTDEVIKFIGTNGITTASDAEGNITISKISELISPTVPTVGGTASASEAGITYLTEGLSKWAIFTEGAFTVGEWTDVQIGWTVTDNNGFTDTIAGRGSFGAASFQTTANDWPSPASGKTYVFASPDYQLGYTDPVEITVGSNDWTFGNDGSLTLPVGGDIRDSEGNSVLGGADTGNWTFDSNTLSEGGAGDAVIEASDYAGAKLILQTRGLSNKQWAFDQDGALTFPDDTVQTTAYTGYHNGDMTGSVFADDSTLLVDGVNAIVPNSELSKSVTQVIDSDATINTSENLTTDNAYLSSDDFVADVDPSLGFVIPGLSQRNDTEIEVNLFVDAGEFFQTYLLGLTLGRTVIATYSTASGNQTFTSTISQVFSGAGGQVDPGTGWYRTTGRILGTVPAGYTGLIGINFPVYSTESHTWTFDLNGDLTAPGNITTGTNGGRFVQDCGDGITSIRWINIDENNDAELLRFYTGDPGEESGDAERAQIKLNWQSADQSGLTIKSFDQDSNEEHDWEFRGDGDLRLPGDGEIIIRDNDNEVGRIIPGVSDGGGLTVQAEVDLELKVNDGEGGSAIWSFEPDGGIVFPDDTVQTTAWTGILPNPTYSGSDQIGEATPAPLNLNNSAASTLLTQLNLINTGGGPGAGSAIDFWTYTSINDVPQVRLQAVDDGDYSADFAIKIKANGEGGNGSLTTTWSFGANGKLTVPGDIVGYQTYVSENPADERVTIQPSGSVDKPFLFTTDQTNGTWERSSMELPGAEIDKAVTLGFPHNNITTGYIYNQGTDTQSGTEFNNAFNIMANSTDVKISTVSGGGNKVWKFAQDGNLEIPGDIKSEGNINIDINLSDSTLRRWTFGEDGDLTFPDATTQTTAFTGNAATIDITDTNGIDTNYYLTFVENRDGGEILRADIDLIFNSADNTLTAGNITTGVLKIDDGVHEKYQELADATGTVTHDCSSGHIFYHASPDANWTVNLTNLNLSTGYATTITIIIDQGGTGYYPNALQIGGAAQTINWQGNATPTPSTNRQDVVSFSILAVTGGSYIVFGQLTGF
jgi:hypothetical protein